jgi:exopolysaccharide biosynthesis operon protein EpsL
MKTPAPILARCRNRSRGVCGFYPLTVFALVVALLAQPVSAQVFSTDDRPIPVKLRLNTSIMWDANLFRLPNSAPDPQLARGIPGKSDRIATTSVALLVDKVYAQQRFQLDASQTAKRNDTFTNLNTDAFQYHGAWLWSLTPRISGSLSASHAESLIPFTDLTSTERNVRITNNRSFNVDNWIFGGWHLLAGAVNTETKTSAVFLAQPGASTNAGNLGLKYAAASGNSITATRRLTSGTNNLGATPNPASFIAREFRFQESELMTTWKISGKSTLNGRLTRQDRQNQGLSQRDFSATNGELGYIWAGHGGQQLNLSASRSVLPWTADTQASYKVDDRLSLTQSLPIGNRLTLSMSAYRLVSDFLGPIVPLTGPPRRDTLRSAQIALVWSPPMRDLQFSGSVQRDQRSSNAAGINYEDTVAMLNAALTF